MVTHAILRPLPSCLPLPLHSPPPSLSLSVPLSLLQYVPPSLLSLLSFYFSSLYSSFFTSFHPSTFFFFFIIVLLILYSLPFSSIYFFFSFLFLLSFFLSACSSSSTFKLSLCSSFLSPFLLSSLPPSFQPFPFLSILLLVHNSLFSFTSPTICLPFPFLLASILSSTPFLCHYPFIHHHYFYPFISPPLLFTSSPSAPSSCTHCNTFPLTSFPLLPFFLYLLPPFPFVATFPLTFLSSSAPASP